MKYTILLLSMLFFMKVNAQTEANMIVGKWMKIPKEDLIIEVYATEGKFNGKIDWSKDTTKQKGFLIVENLQFDENSGSWESGKIFDPRSGSQYKAAAKIKADGTLEVLGYKGLKMIGSKRSFKRVE